MSEIGLEWGVVRGMETHPYLCPYCNKEVEGIKNDVIVSISELPSRFKHANDAYYILRCPACSRPTIYNVSKQNTFPVGKALRSISHLPANIQNAYDEVSTAISAGCYTAAVVYGRTVIAHIAVDRGAKDNLRFVEYVDFLATNGYAPPNSKDWIDKIRTMGNAATHDLEFWTDKDAQQIGKFLMYLLIFIYELPNEA